MRLVQKGADVHVNRPFKDVVIIPMVRAAKAELRRILEDAGLLPRRPGRQDVWRASDRGELVDPKMAVSNDGGGTLRVSARPKAKLSFRVYRAATGNWSPPVEGDAVEVVVKEE